MQLPIGSSKNSYILKGLVIPRIQMDEECSVRQQFYVRLKQRNLSFMNIDSVNSGNSAMSTLKRLNSYE